MNNARIRRPSASLVISILALIVAIAGGGQAFADAGARISGMIHGKQIRKGSIPGDRIRKDSLTGKQIDESKLGMVPSAASAESLSGTKVKAFNFSSTTAGASQEIGTFAGFKVVASCDGATAPHLTVQNNGDSNGEFLTNRFSGDGVANTGSRFLFVPGAAEDAINLNRGTATFTAARLSGGVLTGQIIYDNRPSYGGALQGCTVAGSLTFTG